MNNKRVQLENIYREALITLIIHTMKTFSSKETPISIPQINNGIYMITGQAYSINTVKRYLYDLLDIMTAESDYGNMNQMLNAFIYTYGGIIREVPNPNSKNNSGNRYYFDPIFSSGDINMLMAAITASRFFNDNEKEYYYSRLRTLNTYEAHKGPQNTYAVSDQETITTNARRILTQKNNNTHTEHSRSDSCPSSNELLHIIQVLDYSIHEKKQINLRYGSYNYDDSRLNHLKLIERKKKYILNPYALCWNNGTYYLIGTNAGESVPYHFRVDRIIHVDMTENPIEEIPDTLLPYFKTKHFDVNEYTRAHPYMAIYNESDRVDCTLELSANALSILVDYFGKDILLTKTDKESTITDGKSVPILEATILDIEYSCLLMFVIQHHNTMKVLSPRRLVNDIKNELIKSLHKYD